MEVGGKGDTQSPTMINCVLDLHICRLSCSQWSTVISWLWPWDVSDWQPPVPPFTDTPHRYLLGGGHGSHAGAGLDLRKLHSRHQDSTGSRGGFISDLKKQFLSSAGDVSPPAELVVGGGWWSGGAASPQTEGRCRPCWAECCVVSSQQQLPPSTVRLLQTGAPLGTAARHSSDHHNISSQSGQQWLVRASYQVRSKYSRDQEWLLRPGMRSGAASEISQTTLGSGLGWVQQFSFGFQLKIFSELN